MAVSPPTYTQLPNEILDLMPEMEESELRVVLVIARQTFGWHRESDRISVNQLMAKTGMARQSVLNGIQAAIERGLVERKPVGAQGYCYKLLISMPERQPVQSVDRSNGKTGPVSRRQPVQSVDREPVQPLDPQKKELNKGNTSGGVARETAAAAVDQDVITDLMLAGLDRSQALKAAAIRTYTADERTQLKQWRKVCTANKPGAVLWNCLKHGDLPDDLPPPPQPEQVPMTKEQYITQQRQRNVHTADYR